MPDEDPSQERAAAAAVISSRGGGDIHDTVLAKVKNLVAARDAGFEAVTAEIDWAARDTELVARQAAVRAVRRATIGQGCAESDSAASQDATARQAHGVAADATRHSSVPTRLSVAEFCDGWLIRGSGHHHSACFAAELNAWRPLTRAEAADLCYAADGLPDESRDTGQAWRALADECIGDQGPLSISEHHAAVERAREAAARTAAEEAVDLEAVPAARERTDQRIATQAAVKCDPEALAAQRPPAGSVHVTTAATVATAACAMTPALAGHACEFVAEQSLLGASLIPGVGADGKAMVTLMVTLPAAALTRALEDAKRAEATAAAAAAAAAATAASAPTAAHPAVSAHLTEAQVLAGLAALPPDARARVLHRDAAERGGRVSLALPAPATRGGGTRGRGGRGGRGVGIVGGPGSPGPLDRRSAALKAEAAAVATRQALIADTNAARTQRDALSAQLLQREQEKYLGLLAVWPVPPAAAAHCEAAAEAAPALEAASALAEAPQAQTLQEGASRAPSAARYAAFGGHVSADACSAADSHDVGAPQQPLAGQQELWQYLVPSRCGLSIDASVAAGGALSEQHRPTGGAAAAARAVVDMTLDDTDDAADDASDATAELPG